MNYTLPGLSSFASMVLLLLCLLAPQSGSARELQPVKGRVSDLETGKPLPFVTVFLNNTTYGTQTDSLGNFSFLAPAGNYEIVVNLFSFQPVIFPVEVPASSFYHVKLKPLQYDLKEIKVEARRDEIWYRNFNKFKLEFLGYSANARECTILNPEVLIIDYNRRTKVLSVQARDVLVIENNALGYRLEYLLDMFQVDYREGRVTFQGYPRFVEMEKGGARLKKWQKKRIKSYQGSIQHFLQNAVSANLEEAGYKVYRVKYIPNPARPSEERIAAARLHLEKAWKQNSIVAENDTSRMIVQAAREPKYVKVVDKTELSPELFIKEENGLYHFHFTDVLGVLYRKEPAETAFTGRFGTSQSASRQETDISFTDGPVQITRHGHLAEPLKVLLNGYMGWEKIGHLLPVDYAPPKK